MGRLGMAQPLIPPHYPYPPVHTSSFEANSSSLASLLKDTRMDTITSNTLEAMTIQVIKSHRSLEYELTKLTLQSAGDIDPNPNSPLWKRFTDNLVSVFATDATLTPEMSQPESGVDDRENGVDDSNDNDTERVPLTRIQHSQLDVPYAIFRFDLNDSFETQSIPTDSSQSTTSSDSTL